jgi:hypothetical protein
MFSPCADSESGGWLEDSAEVAAGSLIGSGPETCPSLDSWAELRVVESFAAEEDDCEDNESDGWTGEEARTGSVGIACASVLEVVDGTGGSVLMIEVGPTGILPLLAAFCPFGAPTSPCWLASVEFENCEAILTCVY